MITKRQHIIKSDAIDFSFHNWFTVKINVKDSHLYGESKKISDIKQNSNWPSIILCINRTLNGIYYISYRNMQTRFHQISYNMIQINNRRCQVNMILVNPGIFKIHAVQPLSNRYYFAPNCDTQKGTAFYFLNSHPFFAVLLNRLSVWHSLTDKWPEWSGYCNSVKWLAGERGFSIGSNQLMRSIVCDMCHQTHLSVLQWPYRAFSLDLYRVQAFFSFFSDESVE